MSRSFAASQSSLSSSSKQLPSVMAHYPSERFAPEVSDGEEEIDLQEHHDWSLRMWQRIDRDNSGEIDRSELDCEEFRTIIKAVLARAAGASMGGASYGRSQMNIKQCLNLCLRKADLNHNTCLSFEEFKMFTLELRKTRDSRNTADWIFALFDINGDGKLDEQEFREIYRFYLGHHPTEVEFQAEWAKLDERGLRYVTREQYIKFLQTSDNAVFSRHAPPIKGRPSSSEGDSQEIKSFTSFAVRRRRRPAAVSEWNQGFTSSVNSNLRRPKDKRTYFSRPQSLPELSRYYERHKGFRKHRRQIDIPTPREKPGVLSTETQPSLMPWRYTVGGKMKHQTTGEATPWTDFWQPPASALARKDYKPGTLTLRCSGVPPPGRFLPEDDY
mmetsp:Transcript_17722/g.41213  ORF Transcript_17722/g.41213 Transcript_17722/m.41213 type:complete len:386 (-) Transcript_17722:84-1241(-)|eukprot:CAMPEP_0178428312 /NCGR_PEP_ID=MMETSP0689_2-20121128/30211_1 /TAXON_ID=160604 /ORGANISM="Amphidinium massartii, Strain CS-259" /LENGTH=385 /DNA_ID=CAMNT_0020050077 /DNA_START=57 /DNA_END=1214 /DNA_ORIENTATION=+